MLAVAALDAALSALSLPCPLLVGVCRESQRLHRGGCYVC